MTVAVHYRVRVLPEAHELEVELRLQGLPAGPLRLATPTWVPGAYGFMKYGRGLFGVQAADPAGRALPVTRDGWSGFSLDCPGGTVAIRFHVHAMDPAWGELTGFVGSDQALLLATHYLYAPAHAGPCTVEYLLPEDWALHQPASAQKVGPATFEHPSFAALLDTPVAVGRFSRHTRNVHGVPFHFVFFDEALGAEQRRGAFLDALVRLAGECHRVFGAFPFRDYTFFFTFDPRAKWGLEHADATTIALDADTFVDEASWARGLRVSAHELFHAWNVCRLKPAPLGAPDLQRGSFPDALWVSEGITRYYEFLLLARAGILGAGEVFSNVVNYHRQLAARPAYQRVDLLDSSRSTFQNHNRYPGAVNTTIDYYDAGMLVAFDLDVALRQAGDSLDAAFSAFYAAHVGRGAGFTHADAKTFFSARVPATGELLARECEQAGQLGVVASLASLGFELGEAQVRRLGLVLDEKSPGEIADVLDDSPAGRCGLAPGDVITSVEGHPFGAKGLAWAVRSLPRVALSVRRGSRTLDFAPEPEERQEIASLTWRGTEAQAEFVRAWMGSPGFAPRPGEPVPLTAYENFHGIQKVV